MGDSRYKTNFFLQFIDKFTKKLYERHLMPSALYSIRLFIMAATIYDLIVIDFAESIIGRLALIVVAMISMVATLKRNQKLNVYNKQLMIVSHSNLIIDCRCYCQSARVS